MSIGVGATYLTISDLTIILLVSYLISYISHIKLFSYWVSIGTGVNYPAMELIGPLLPEVVNIECLPHSNILGNDTHICMSYE